MEKDDKHQIQFEHYEQYYNVLWWLKKADAQSGMSNSGKIKMIRSLRMPLFGNENPIFAWQSFLGIMKNLDGQSKDKNLMKIDYFDEWKCQHRKMAFFESMKADMR